MSAPPVPILDLQRARRRIADELEGRWAKILGEGSFVLGGEVKEFECAFTGLLGARAAVAVGNGTDALVVAMRALDLAPGDEVIVPAFSFFATAEAVLWAGGRPVFADIDPATLNLDPDDAAARITPRTVGILGVHLYGRPFDAERLRALAHRNGLWLVEDAAQAHGARFRGERVGTLGQLAAWSFYPTKNLGCFGDGGAISGMDEALMQRVARVANHGQAGRYHHVEIGTNSRLDSLQAAVLNCRLPLLAGDNARRRELAALYRDGLSGIGDLAFPVDDPRDECVYHQMMLATDRRDALQAHLKDHGIASAVHYPSPLHRQPALAALGYGGEELPHAAAAAQRGLCLPMFPELTAGEVDRVVGAVRAFYGA